MKSGRRRKLTRERNNSAIDKILSELGDTHEYPSGAQFRTYKSFLQFQVRREEGDEATFRVGDTALLAPKEYDPEGPEVPLHEYYAAEIVDIRGQMKKKAHDVWVLIRWYYSARDPEADLDATGFGQYERLQSQHYDIEHATAFEKVIKMHHLAESAVDIPFSIGPKTWFYRHSFDHVTKTLILDSPLGCTCNVMYDPDASSLDDIMHFCPRPQCRKAYHARCLSRIAQKAISPINVYLAGSPDHSADFASYVSPDDALSNTSSSERPSKRQRTELSSSKTVKFEEVDSDRSIDERLAAISAEHPDLLKIARCPMIRGKAVGGPGGNVRDVVAARRLVYALLVGASLPEDWDSHLSLGHALHVRGIIVDMPRHDSPFACPSCHSAI